MRPLILLLLLSVGTTYAQHRAYHSSEELVKNKLQFDIDTAAHDITIEARCALPANKERAGSNTQWWGITWNNDTDSIIVQGRNTAYGDFTDTPTLDLIYKNGETERKLGSIEGNVNLPSGAHTMAIEWSSHGIANILAGAKNLKIAAQASLPHPLHPTAKIIMSPDARIEIASLVTEWTDNLQKDLYPPFSSAAIDSIMHNSTIPIVGYWQYLDRDTDDALARAGGKYTLAIVPYQNRIFLIYIDGAKILADRWQKGMKKGVLNETPFNNHYDLTWYGSEGKAIDDESYATFDSEGVMTCVFPLHKSQLRFYKTP